MERHKVTLLKNTRTVLTKELYKQLVPPGIIVLQETKKIIHHHSYGQNSRFFEGLVQGKLMGTECRDRLCEVKGILLPPHELCPCCLEEMEWKEIDTSEAKVFSHSIINYPGEGFQLSVPCPLINVEIPGVCTKFMSYLSEFREGEPHIGMPVKPKFRTKKPTYTILDISWVPIEHYPIEH